MKKQASYWQKKTKNKVQCLLCPHKCVIDDGKKGICGVRKNENGVLYSLIYGSYSSIAVDPIEKKPLYHFYPGSSVLSLGSVGCNFKCLHCQNYSISTAIPDDFTHMKETTVEELMGLLEQYDCEGIAWTYNEPTIWHEFAMDASRVAKKKGLYTVFVSNGYINEEPLRDISDYLDAINVDVKGFTGEFYKNICKAGLNPVLDTCELCKDLGIFLELTYLVIPGYNDSSAEIQRFCSWVSEKLGSDVPVHFTRFHPDYKMNDVKSTPMKTLINCYDAAKKNGLDFVYVGNIAGSKYNNTVCPDCGNICIKRNGFYTNLEGIVGNKCSSCGRELPIIF